MKPAFKYGMFFFLLGLLGLSGLAAQAADNLVQSGLPRFSSAIVSNYPMPEHDRENSRLVSINDQPISASDKDNAGYQLIITCNTESYNGYLGPRLDANQGYSRLNPGLRNFTGKTVRLDGLEAGSYTLNFRQDGYQDLTMVLNISGGRQYLLDVVLAARSGILEIAADQSIQELEIDGNGTSSQFPIVLAEGRHRVRVRSFAFEDYLQSVYVSEDTVTRLDISFLPAVFRLTNANISRPRFRPANFGSLGTTNLTFDISSLGSATITIKDQEGRTVRSIEKDQFTTWTQNYSWDGSDETGIALPEGTYDWEISAKPAEGVSGEPQNLRGKVIIDYASFIKFRSIWSGSPGLDFVSDVYSLAPTAFQIGSRLALISSGVSPDTSEKFLVAMNFRYGIYQDIELWVNAGGAIELCGASSRDVLFGGGVGWSIIPMPGIKPAPNADHLDFGLKLNLSGNGLLFSAVKYPLDLDESGILPGGRFGVAPQIRYGVASLLLEPVMHLGAWPVHLESSGNPADVIDLPTANATFFASFHAGIYLDFEVVLVGISAALYTTPSFSLQLPVRTGINIQVMPVENFILGLDFQLKLGTENKLEPAGGLTIGFIQ